MKEKKRTGIQKASVSGGGGGQVLLPEPIYHFMSQEALCCVASTSSPFISGGIY